MFWGQINENAPFAVGGETGDDSPLLINNQMLSSAAGGATSHERGGSSGNRSKKDGWSLFIASRLSACPSYVFFLIHSLGKTSTSHLQDRKKASSGGGATTTGPSISPKL